MRSILALLLAALAAFAAAGMLAFEKQPRVIAGPGLRHEDVGRLRELARRNDPRGLRPGEIRRVSVDERDLNLLLAYGLAPLRRAFARVDLRPASAEGTLTVSLPESPFGPFLNLSVTVSQVADGIVVDGARIGRLPVPGWIANPLASLAHRLLLRFDEYRTAIDAVNGLALFESSVHVVYQWRPELLGSVQRRTGFLFPEEERVRLLAYDARLGEVMPALGRTASLASVLPPLFATARERSRGGEPAVENRSAILALALHMTGTNVRRLVGAPPAPKGRRVRLTLAGRHDLALHFVVSAAATAASGSGLAYAVGLFKELDDSMGGSGFSFADLAADRAGIRFARLASGDSHGAVALQERLAGGAHEPDFMPAIDHLPEGLQEGEFRLRFRDPDSPVYRRMLDEIDARIAACSLHVAPGAGL